MSADETTGEVIGTGSVARWREALSTLPHAWWHTVEAARAWEAGSSSRLFLFHVAEAGVRAACVFAIRGSPGASDLYVPAGFAGFAARGDAARAGAAFRAHPAVHEHVAGYFPLHPVVAVEAAHLGVRNAGNTLFVIDLREGADAAVARVDRSVRRALRDFHGAGGRFVTDRAELAAFVLRHYESFMRGAGAGPATIWPAPMLDAMLADESVLVAGVADDDGLCAAYAFGATPHVGDALVNVSVRRGREHTGPLIAWGIRELASRGVPWLHLGGGVREGDGIAQAKRKFRPVERPQRAACEVYRPDVFTALCRAEGTSAEAACYFPPYRAASVAPPRELP